MADHQRISTIKSATPPVPIEIRIIRKWRPFSRGTKISYLFVDKHGDAVQAFITQLQDDELSQKITLNHCYRLERYVCIPAPGIMKVAFHSASIKLDSQTHFIPIADDGSIPETYYNFASYETVSLRAGINKILTGMVEAIELGEPGSSGPQTRLDIEDMSGEKFRVALWPEIASLLDNNTLIQSQFKLVVVFASLRVTRFHATGKLQFESTSATRLEIEPEQEIAKRMRVMYISRHEGSPEAEQGIKLMPMLSERNRMTIAKLLQSDIDGVEDVFYTCEATFTAFKEGKTWRYSTCPLCSKTMDPEDDGYVCTRHFRQEPKYKFCVKGDISDGTGTVTITIFDSPVYSVVGVTCNDLVYGLGFTDLLKIPEPLQNLKDNKQIFQLNSPEVDADGSVKFLVNRIFKQNSAASNPAHGSSSNIEGPTAAGLNNDIVAATQGESADTVTGKEISQEVTVVHTTPAHDIDSTMDQAISAQAAGDSGKATGNSPSKKPATYITKKRLFNTSAPESGKKKKQWKQEWMVAVLAFGYG